MTRSESAVLGLVIGVLLIVLVMILPENTQDIKPYSINENARNLYEEVLRTQPSRTARDKLDAIIATRLTCYQENGFYRDRIIACNSDYITDIVTVAQNEIKSMPAKGDFVINVRNCPLIYNICFGETEGDQEQCADIERRCINTNLDKFWRGAVPERGMNR